MSASSDLEVRQVVRRFGNLRAVNDVSFAVAEGSFFSILGPSGCGKTTLMRMIAGFLHPDSGDILIKDRSVLGVPPNRRPANMVFQHLALFPMMTVARNIGYGLRRRGVAKAEIGRRVAEILARVGLTGSEAKRVDELSGGQKQRVAIARCLVLDPALLLLDEPLGALDLKLREQMKIELKQLQAQIGTTFVYITHDQSEALVMSDHVAVMNHGRFEQVGTPQELYYEPRTAFVAAFVGNSNRWRGTVERIEQGVARVMGATPFPLVARAGETLREGTPVEVFVRQEAVTIAETPDGLQGVENQFAGVVESLLFDGGNSTALIREARSNAKVTVALPHTGQFATLERGAVVSIGWAADQARCFAAETEIETGAEAESGADIETGAETP